MTEDLIEREIPMSAASGIVSMLNNGEIDMQITTAKKYPRSVSNFRKDVLSLVTLNERVAESCIYAIPRGGKVIEGASARFAEIVASCWGNSRSGARIVNESAEFVTAQGVFLDLEKNVAITYEVQRRITDKAGRRFNADMVGVTGNAACSIALRNAIFKGVPKAFWDDMYEKAKEVVRGDFATLANRRADIFARCQTFGVSKEQVLEAIGITGEADLSLDHIVTLRGMLTAIKDGDTTVELAFAKQDSDDGKPAIKQPQKKQAKQEAVSDVAQNQTGEPSAKQDERGSDGGATGEPITPSQLKVITAKLEAAALSTSDIKAKFGKELNEITTVEFRDVLAFIANPAGV